MRRDEVVDWLRRLRKLRQWVQQIEDALEQLDECERDIIETMYIFPQAYAADKMCEKFMIERAAVYRRRDKGLKKLGNYLEEMRDKSETTFGN